MSEEVTRVAPKRLEYAFMASADMIYRKSCVVCTLFTAGVDGCLGYVLLWEVRTDAEKVTTGKVEP
jgi:hypothetical protein